MTLGKCVHREVSLGGGLSTGLQWNGVSWAGLGVEGVFNADGEGNDNDGGGGGGGGGHLKIGGGGGGGQLED